MKNEYIDLSNKKRRETSFLIFYDFFLADTALAVSLQDRDNIPSISINRASWLSIRGREGVRCDRRRRGPRSALNGMAAQGGGTLKQHHVLGLHRYCA